MTKLMLNASTKSKIDILSRQLPHAVLLSGEPGVGLLTIAKQLAGAELAMLINPVDKKGTVENETGTISVEVIRSLYGQTRTRSTARRIYIIDNAERMSAGASAAFLKLLEEPTPNTHFILTSHSPQSLLLTIRSRLQATTIEPVTLAQTKQLIASMGVTDAKTIGQLEYLAQGLPAELSRLLSDSEYFRQRAEVMSDTRTFLTGSLYQRIIITHKYQQSRPRALQLLDSSLVVTRRSLSAKPQPQLTSQLAALLSTKERIEANGNIKLQLLALVVQ